MAAWEATWSKLRQEGFELSFGDAVTMETEGKLALNFLLMPT